MPKKRRERLCWEGFGFPVILKGVTFKSTPSGYTVMDVNMISLRKSVLALLVFKKTLLTGAQLKFIRASLEMSQSEFAEFIDVAGHSSVAQWEKKADEPTGMSFHTEVVLRLRVAPRLSQSAEAKVIREIIPLKSAALKMSRVPLELDTPVEPAA